MKTVLVTGATSGFGWHTVKVFLANGDRVIATGRNLSQRKDAFVDCREQYKDRLFEVDLDVTQKSQIEALVQWTLQRNFQIDVLVNNAGYGLFGALEELEEEQIRRQFEVNFFGLIQVTQAFLPALRKSKGKIFNLSSAFGFIGFPLSSVYCASKFAVEGLTESLDYELAPHGVQVCLIEPGGYRTKFSPNLEVAKNSSDSKSVYHRQNENYRRLREKMISAPKAADPAEVAYGILKLASEGKMPLRVQFGKDSKGTRLMKSLVPGSFFRWATHSMYSKIFLKELKS